MKPISHILDYKGHEIIFDWHVYRVKGLPESYTNLTDAKNKIDEIEAANEADPKAQSPEPTGRH